MAKKLLTAGQIAEQLQVSYPQVSYVISKYRIKPSSRVGIFRQFDKKAVEVIQQGLYQVLRKKKVNV